MMVKTKNPNDYVGIEPVTVYDATCVCGWRLPCNTEDGARAAGDQHFYDEHATEPDPPLGYLPLGEG
jgi:hypothetical protein